MARRTFIKQTALLATIAAFAILTSDTFAGEIRLRASSQCDGTFVTLGDIAVVLTGDSAERSRLEAIELLPAPIGSKRRYLSVREVQDLLMLHGENLKTHRFSGASKITISAVLTRTKKETRLGATATRRAKEKLTEAIRAYLQKYVSADAPWKIELSEIDDAAGRQVVDARAINITGGRAPWIGSKHFTASVPTVHGQRSFPVYAQLSREKLAVVAIRSISRGEVVSSHDVRLEAVGEVSGKNQPCRTIEEVVGKEASRTLAANRVVMADSIRTIVLVRRGEVVTVTAQSGSVVIKTQARAKESGGEGDLIRVQSPIDRKEFFARVTNIGECEVFARSAKVLPTPEPIRTKSMSPKPFTTPNQVKQTSYTTSRQAGSTVGFIRSTNASPIFSVEGKSSARSVRSGFGYADSGSSTDSSARSSYSIR